MDLHALKIFQTVAQTGNITQAAKELNYAQSNITTKIQQLETELQASLFYRHNRGTTLTTKGKMLLTYTDKIFHLIEETTKVMREDDTPKGPLTIGSMETTAAVRLPQLLSKYHHDYPDVDLTIRTGTTEKSIHGVLQYELDGAFVAGPVDHPDLIQKTVIEEELALITNTIHPPLASIRDIQTRTLLVFHAGCSYRAKLEQWFLQEGIFPNKIMEFNSLEALLGCVYAGLGISLLPISVVERHIQAGTFCHHAISNAHAKVQTVFIHRKDTYMTTSLLKFMEMFGEEQNLVPSPIML